MALCNPSVNVSLVQLGTKYGTDKVQHRYLGLYASAFGAARCEVRRMLEVGVFHGASIQMWRDYFPNAQVFGVDSFAPGRGYSHLSAKQATRFLDAWRRGEVGPRITLIQADASDETVLRQLGHRLAPSAGSGGEELFDLIVEDGSHLQRDQQLGLGYLMPLVRPGGTYVVEDISSGRENGYDEPAYGANTTINILKEFNRTRRMRSKHLTRAQLEYLDAWIESASTVVTRRQRHDVTTLVRKRSRASHAPGFS